MNHAITAVIKKDFRGITANRRLFFSLLIVPIVFTVFLPGMFITIAHFMSEDEDLQMLLELLPRSSWASNMELTVTGLIFNNILPVFFLMIPIMASSIMAASSFVGEKEKHTLETLLYSPLTLGQIFQAKILASFLMSMTVSLISFVVMLTVVELEVFLLMGTLLVPSANWPVILLLLSPAVSMIAVTLIVRGSAKAQSVEESQQGAVFMIIPVLLLIVGQFTGVLLVSLWILLGLSLLCVLLALFLLKKAAERFTYEMLLQ